MSAQSCSELLQIWWKLFRSTQKCSELSRDSLNHPEGSEPPRAAQSFISPKSCSRQLNVVQRYPIALHVSSDLRRTCQNCWELAIHSCSYIYILLTPPKLNGAIWGYQSFSPIGTCTVWLELVSISASGGQNTIREMEEVFSVSFKMKCSNQNELLQMWCLELLIKIT